MMWWLTLVQRAARYSITFILLIFRFGTWPLYRLFLFAFHLSGIDPSGNTASVGLINQGATCFLNTLLQTWFLTPEVKQSIYKLNSNVAFVRELQNLFNKLESKEEKYIRTNELTMSLQLNVFKQLDIEEFFRNLINKLNAEVGQGDNILKLYQITMVQSMKCSVCEELVTEDCFFLDLPLSIFSPDSSSEIKSLEESLKMFLEAVTLDYDNAPYCDTCNKKTKTKTRYYFKQLPQLLTFQLKRFGVASNGKHYQKIHLQISIPLTLQFYKSLDNANEWCFKPTIAKVEKYELFAIWHHVGEYECGHYYAEIKCGNCWYIFNDEKIDKQKKKENSFRSKTAYLIMYRRQNSEKQDNNSQNCPRILGADAGYRQQHINQYSLES
ncbi:ubiquitin carboxyl-terminal hydrolase 47-like isoform X2 [Chiloscyllium plagiosum]|uniref:ubiquitin carboxyl-terminal hydrolase 47-like isoform X2 n=1 Tax=Chiloscyllium plagiosum TaxID=36176 RepID=UPI001CB81B56|nr:ubiquitin carboxyl-terminal hydrolase 47-like isoform X2 [Chiloscyllium plagiosum]